ncbi:MAG: TIGR00725 family protein [Acidobacteriota bacterium]
MREGTGLRIGVMGAGECSQEIYALAEETGRLIARHHAVLICGGRGGVMEAAAKGAKSEGGLTIGILPEADTSRMNPYIEVPIVTGMGNARNVINVLSSQAVIAISGGFGTLSEVAIALKCGVPVVGLRTWQLASELEPAVGPDLLQLVQTPEEAVTQAIRLAGLRQRGGPS